MRNFLYGAMRVALHGDDTYEYVDRSVRITALRLCTVYDRGEEKSDRMYEKQQWDSVYYMYEAILEDCINISCGNGV